MVMIFVPTAVIKSSHQGNLKFWLRVQATVHQVCRTSQESTGCMHARAQFALSAVQFRIPLPKE